ncbi:MAG TPA: hypothetical protein VG318_18035 [Actinomycetota bacterium]|nr:hypothetical protein [Actinomycetota bacterium]
MALGLAQTDFEATRFTSETPERIRLDMGERRSVYLTPEESGVFNFDFYPGDLRCAMEGPDGQMVSGREIHEEHRWVDGWNRHWGVETFRAPEAGTYDLTCRDTLGGRRYPLVLARPGRFGRVYPELALFILVPTATAFAAALILGGVRDRCAGRNRP